MRRFGAIALGVTCALGVAACGSGSHGSSNATGSSFATKADSICTQQARQVTAAAIPVNSGATLVAYNNAVTPAIQRSYDELKALKPPASGQREFQRFLADARRRIAILHSETTAGKRNDVNTFGRLDTQARGVLADADKQAAALGLHACAERLPAAEQAKVRQVAIRNATVNDPAECTTSFTPAYIKLQFGSRAKCLAQQRGKSPVTAVDVTDVVGVSHVYARAHLVPHGGPPNGKKFVAEFIYQNGRWKQDTLTPLP